MIPANIAHVLALLIAAIAAFTDARTGHIPNWLTLPPIAAAPIAWGLVAGWRVGLFSVAAALACGLVPYLLFRRGAMHGGDVKLFAALGAVLGMSVGIEAQFFAYMAAAIYALGALAWKGKLLGTLASSALLVVNPILPKSRRREIKPEMVSMMRLGVPIFVGTLCAVGLRHPEMLPQ